MKYRKYDMGSYNLHVINSDKFKTVTVRINFKRALKKEEITYRNLLIAVLLETSEKYASGRLIEIETEKLYGLEYSMNNFISGNYNVLSCIANFLNEKYTEEGMLEKSISFMLEIISRPNVINDKFESTSFEMAKRIITENLESIEERPNLYSMIRLFEEMDKKSPISYRGVGYLEDLEKITEENLYDYYKSVIKKDLIDVFVTGDFNSVDIKSLIGEKIRINTLKKPGESHYIEHKQIRKKVKVVKEKMDFEQSKLLIGFKTSNLTEFEKKYVMIVYSFILGGSPNSKLFRTVREKNSLCYSISSNYNMVNNTFIIKSGINSKDYRKATFLIKKELKNMEKGLFDDTDIEAAKVTFISSCKELEDNQSSILNTYVGKEYLDSDLLEERKKKILKVTRKELIELTKKIHMDTIFLLEGNEQDETNSDN